MISRTQRSTRANKLLPYTTLFRSPVAAGLPGCGLDLVDDPRPTLVRIDQHLRPAQRVDVVLGAPDTHRLVVHEAVAAAHAVGLDAAQFPFPPVPAPQHDRKSVA